MPLGKASRPVPRQRRYVRGRVAACFVWLAVGLSGCLPEPPPSNLEATAPAAVLADGAPASLTARGFNLTLSTSTPSVPADGASAIGVTALVTNSFSMPMTGAPVSFSASGGPNALLSPSTAFTDCSGRARTSVSATNTGTQRITAQISATRSSIDLNFTCPGYFLAPKVWPTFGTLTGAAFLVDVNGDRNLDVLAVLVNSGIGVLLGNGNGSFSVGPTYNLVTPRGVTSCDLNNDGFPDIVASNANQVTTFLGRGDGNFLISRSITVGLAAYELACADLNKDGNQDVVVGHQSSSFIMTLLGNGDGTLQTGVSYATGGSPLAVSLADLNADTYVDIVAASSTANAVSVFLNNGSGSFPTSFTYATGSSPRHIALADFNGDAKLDMAITNSGSTTVSQYSGNGNGTFAASGNILAVATQPYWISAGDLNGDQKVDLVVSDNTGNALSYLAGDGAGGFAAKVVTSVSQNPLSAVLGDLNGDGILDVVATNSAINAIHFSVLLNNGLGALSPWPKQNLATGAWPIRLAMGQASGDSLPLLANNTTNAGGLEVRQGFNDGSFGPAVVVSGLSNPQGVLVTDLTNDNRVDVVVLTNNSPNNLYVYPGNGDGTLQAPLSAYTGNTPYTVAAADFNKDGNPDLVVSNNGGNTIAVLLGTGSGAMGLATPYVVGSNPMDVATGDINNDGNVDVVVAVNGNSILSTLLGQGNGTLQAAVTSATGQAYRTLALGDLNGDGKLDITAATSFGVTVSLGNNSATPLGPVYYNLGCAVSGHAIGDINKDGIPDVVLTCVVASSFYTYLGNADGTLQGPVASPTGIINPGFPVVRDVNGDGRSDVLLPIAANYFARTISIMLSANTCKTSTTTLSGSANSTLTYNAGSLDLIGTAELTPSNADTPSNAFVGGSQTGTLWDATNLQVHLGNGGGCNAATTNCSSLDANWTPQYASLLGYWPLDGSGTPAVSSTLAGTVGSSLTLAGAAATYQAGQLTNGLNLAANGNAYLVLPTGAPSGLPFTLVGWTKWAGGIDGQRVVEFGQDTNNFLGLSPAVGGQLTLVASNANVLSTATAPYPLAVGRWQHVALSVSSTGATAYVNGVPAVSLVASVAAAQAVSSVNYVGKSHAAALPFYNGSFDELSIFNGALDANQINQIYSRQMAFAAGTFTSRILGPQGVSSPWTDLAWSTNLPCGKGIPSRQASESQTVYPGSAGLALNTGQVLLWHMDEQSAGTAPGGADFFDDSGQANHGKLNGGVTLGTPGILGNSASFDGNNGSAAAVLPIYYPGTFSISVWLNSQSLNGGRIAGFGDASSGNSVNFDRHIYLDSNNALRFGYTYGASKPTVNSASGLNDGRWHHILATSNNLHWYLDGVNQGAVGAGANLGYTGFWRIGGDTLTGWSAQPNSIYFQGRIDEFSVYKIGLSAADAKALWRRGANRLRFQIRTCTSMSCADNPSWRGPDGSSFTYFSEAHNALNPLMGNTNTLVSSPDLFFSSFAPSLNLPANAYFQYKMVLESDDAQSQCSGPCSPEVLSVRAGPYTYATSGSVISTTGTTLHGLTGMTVTYGPGGCPGGVSFNLSNNGGTSWYWYNGYIWSLADGTAAQSNSPAQLSGAVLNAFVPQKGFGSITYRAFLNSSGNTPCTLSSVTIQGVP
jgi:hypothetical protein